MKKRSGRQIFRYLASILVFAILLAFVYARRADFADLSIRYPWALGIAILGVVGNIYLQGYLSYVSSVKLGADISLRDSILVGILTLASNMLLPMRGGLAVRALYMKRKHGMALTNSLTTILAYYLINICLTSLVAAFSLIFTAGKSVELWGIFAFCVCLILGCLIAMTFSGMLLRIKFWPGIVVQVLEGWITLRSDRQVFLRLLAASSMEITFNMVVLYGTFLALDAKMDLQALIPVTAMSNMATLASITPGALGIYEAIVSLASLSFGIPVVTSVAAALLSRVLLIVVLLLFAPLAIYLLTQKNAIQEYKPNEAS